MDNDLVEQISPYEYHNYLLELVISAKQNFVMMGRMLYYLKQNESFKEVIGEGIDTWNDYLQQPEIGLSIGEANRLVQIYENFVLKLGFSVETISEVPIKNLHYLLPIIKGMDNVDKIEELLADATLLSQKDFKERIYDIKSNDKERTYEYLVMKKCIETGNMNKVHEIDSEVIKETFNLEE